MDHVEADCENCDVPTGEAYTSTGLRSRPPSIFYRLDHVIQVVPSNDCDSDTIYIAVYRRQWAVRSSK